MQLEIRAKMDMDNNRGEAFHMGSQRKLVFYGAISVDGYIVREDHSLGWLIETEGEKETSLFRFLRNG